MSVYTKRREILCDDKVVELAAHFLDGSPINNETNRKALAAHIQLEIEAWLTFEEEESEMGRPR